MDTVLRRSTGDRSFGAKAPLAEYTVSASYGAGAAGSSIPEGLSSRPAVAGIVFRITSPDNINLWYIWGASASKTAEI